MMTASSMRLPLWTAGLLAILLMSGCGKGRLTLANYEEIQSGMSTKEVEAILGKPTEMKSSEIPLVSTSAWIYVDGEDRISLTFFNDKLVSKEANLRE